jgi:hypothetical protein
MTAAFSLAFNQAAMAVNRKFHRRVQLPRIVSDGPYDGKDHRQGYLIHFRPGGFGNAFGAMIACLDS